MQIIFLALLKKIVNTFFREASKPQSDSCSLFQIIFVPWEIQLKIQNQKLQKLLQMQILLGNLREFQTKIGYI